MERKEGKKQGLIGCLRSEQKKASTNEKTQPQPPAVYFIDPSLIKSKKTQIPALLTFAVASNTDVLNSIIKRVRRRREWRKREKKKKFFFNKVFVSLLLDPLDKKFFGFFLKKKSKIKTTTALLRRLPAGRTPPPLPGSSARPSQGRARARPESSSSQKVKKKMLRALSSPRKKRAAAAAAAAAGEADAPPPPSSSGNVAVVTGGSGFLGRHLVRALEESGRYSEVVVFDVRPWQAPKWPAASKALPKSKTSTETRGVVGDLTDLASVVSGLSGASVVFHCATAAPAASNAANKRLMTRVNVDGTRNVVEACLVNAIPRLVFTSSASVVFDGSDLSGVDESAPYAARPMDYYAATKIEAEKIVLAANGAELKSKGARGKGKGKGNKQLLRTVALRPSGIFGEHDALLVPTIVEKAKAGKMKFIIGSGENVMDWTYAGNVAAAHLAADEKLQQEEEEESDEAAASENGGVGVGGKKGKSSRQKTVTSVAGKPYFVTNDDPRSFWGFMGDLLEPLGYERPRVKLPFWPLYIISWLVAAVVALLNLVPGLTVPSSDFSPMRITISAAERRLSCAAAKRELGYLPAVSIEEGVKRTVAAFAHLKKRE